VATRTVVPTKTAVPTRTATPECLTLGQKISLLIGIFHHFGKHEGQQGYRARYDLNHDGVIDWEDVRIVIETPRCRHHHHHWW
jgi:hypothetical protein